jgi:D-serine deaminase-like pyridoxal phosphate-dependent protein
VLTLRAEVVAQCLQHHAVAVWTVAGADMLVAAAVLSGGSAVLQTPNHQELDACTDAAAQEQPYETCIMLQRLALGRSSVIASNRLHGKRQVHNQQRAALQAASNAGGSRCLYKHSER